MLRYSFIFCVLFLIVFSSISAVQAAEVIHRYDTDIIVERDGDLVVTETIQVTAEGRDIKRGIYRDFPLARRTFLGGLLPSSYNIISVKRDGKPEAYHREMSENSMRLYVGESNYYLPKGRRYTYEIKYSVKRQVFYYDSYDELHWNVIGTGWSFPIEKATADIHLPMNAEILDYAAYTGKALSKGNDYRSSAKSGHLALSVTKVLEPHEGLTVALSFPKGVVQEYQDMRGVSFFWLQHPGLYKAIIGFLFMAVYYYWGWVYVGRDPDKRTLTPFYDAPPGISPAMAAYISKMGGSRTEKEMTASVLSLAAKGYFEIEEMKKKGRYKIVRTAQSENEGPPISEEERIIYDVVKSSLTTSPHNATLIAAASKHGKKLSEICEGRYFNSNSLWWFMGGVPLLLTLGIIALEDNVETVPLIVGFIFALTFGGVSLSVMIMAISKLRHSTAMQKANNIFLIIWASLFSMGGFMGIFIMAATLSWLLIGVLLAMVLLFIVMRHLMKAPTRKGRSIMDHIDGLQYYMETVEEKILKKFDPPQMSRELYEKYLPYAVALDVEGKWSDKFIAAIGGAAALAAGSGAVTGHPSWYRASSNRSSSSGGFSMSSMVGSFGSALSAASSSQSSSGGGSVGGGGGGGGGGGW